MNWGELPDEIPAKQGLKHNMLILVFAEHSYSRTKFQQNKDWNPVQLLWWTWTVPSPGRNSSKTRIETLGKMQMLFFLTHSRTKFQQNKDWNLLLWITPKPESAPGRNSSKTRIETEVYPSVQRMSFFSRTKFQQNKDWNTWFVIYYCIWLGLPDEIPAKQGLKLKIKQN